MTQYKTLNVKLSNSGLNGLKSGIKNGTEEMLFDSKDENNFPQKLLLTNTQVSRLCKAFENNLSASIKLSKTQLYEICRSGGFLGKEQVKKQLEILSQILKHKSIIKTNLNLMMFIPEIIYLK